GAECGVSTAGAVAVGEVNGDGVLDRAVANRGTPPTYADGSVSVLLGNGDGSFQTARDFRVGTEPMFVAVGEVNGDGLPDLAVANPSSADLSLLSGHGDGSFQAARHFCAGRLPSAIALREVHRRGPAHPAPVLH